MTLTIERDSASQEVDASIAAPLRVGVAGLGVIGEGAALRLVDDASYEFCAALVSNKNKPRPGLPETTLFTDDIDAFLDHDLDVVFDALPCGKTGQTLIEKALTKGISIVSANKQAVAGSIAPFNELARKSGANFYYAASVGGGAPMVETARAASEASEVESISAIVNGTVNYVLSALASGASFDQAVKDAQDAGFAEPDPTADLSGDDARAKLSILSFELFGEEVAPDAVTTQALDAAQVAEITEKGGVWRQVSTLKRDEGNKILADVRFQQVDDDSFLRDVRGEGNALRVINKDGKQFLCRDKGAGRGPTVGSLFSDLLRINNARQRPPE